jgi:CheY-like chemotaxis protein/nitrogen-specific signal transduction histidine kinase
VEDAKLLVEEKVGQLAVSSRYKSEFIANMSHELRTPLNSLLILAEQLEDNSGHTMTDAQVEYAGVIRASGQDLLKLLNSILDLAKIESGTVTVERERVSVDQLRRDMVREFEHVANSQSLSYRVEIAPRCPSTIVTDAQRLRQILKNLVANAFKFTETGGVRVEIGTAVSGWSKDSEPLNTAPSVLSIAVVDTGIGIDREQQQRIFEAFAQGDGTTSRLYGGTGLGLSISRALVGLLGGEITLASHVGTGSTFNVYIPLGDEERIGEPVLAADLVDISSATQLGAEPGANAARVGPDRTRQVAGLDDHPFEGASVLIVDDDFRNIFALTALLERGHARVAIAEGGKEALAVLAVEPSIDIVLMDIMMPGMDGYQTMQAIRAVERFQSLPIVAVTGKVVTGERRRCIEAGANAYLPKPVTSTELIAAISPWLTATSEAAP